MGRKVVKLDAEARTRLSKIYAVLSAEERRQLKALSFGDHRAINMAIVEKLIERGLVLRDGEKFVGTLDGLRIALWC